MSLTSARALCLGTTVLAGCLVITDFDATPAPSTTTAAGGSASGGGPAGGGENGGGGEGGEGDAGGAAPDCTVASDCASFEDDNACQTTTCDNGSCAVDHVAAGTPVGNQTPGDCELVACDGAGDVVTLADDDPASDANDCTDDVCNGTITEHPNSPLNTPCGAGAALACDGMGNCSGCTMDGQCNPDTDCVDYSCNMAMAVCTSTVAANGTLCTADGSFCNGVEVCLNAVCSSPGDPCDGPDGDSDCTETCDDVADNCEGNDDNGTSCADALFCNGVETCVAGTCAAGAPPCDGPGDGDADCAETCDDNTDACVNDANGTPCDDGLFCTTSDMCNGGMCGAGGPGPCPGEDFDSNCRESCNEDTDTCNADDYDGAFCRIGSTDGCCMMGSCDITGGCF